MDKQVRKRMMIITVVADFLSVIPILGTFIAIIYYFYYGYTMLDRGRTYLKNPTLIIVACGCFVFELIPGLGSLPWMSLGTLINMRIIAKQEASQKGQKEQEMEDETEENSQEEEGGAGYIGPENDLDEEDQYREAA